MADGIKNRIGQYLYADGALRRRVIGKTTYAIGIAGALDAFGLIGPEHNGIFVLDDTQKRVLTDRQAETSSGYHGPTPAQWAELKRVMQLPAKAFLQWVKETDRYRGGLSQ
jgi:hypothetical protein